MKRLVCCFLIFAFGWFVGQKVQIPISPFLSHYSLNNETKLIYADEPERLLIEGSWASNGLYDSSEPQVSDIVCEKQECKMVTASVSHLGDSPYLQLRFDDFDITKWGEDEIIGVDSSPFCFTGRLVINRRSKNVKLIEAPRMPGEIGYTKDAICDVIKEDGNRIYTSVLVDGEKATAQHLNWKNLFR